MRVREQLRRVLDLVRPEGRPYTLGLMSLFVVNLSDVIAPLFMALAVELTEASLTGKAASTPAPMALVGFDATSLSMGTAVVAYFLLHLTASVFRYPMMMLVAVPSHRIGQTVRRQIADRLLRQSQSYFDRSKSGDLMSTATADVNAVRMMLGPGIMIAFDTLMLSVMVLGLMFTLSWKLALYALIPVPIIYWVTNILSHAEYKGFTRVQEDLARMTERARESFAGIRIIQGYAQEAYDRRRFREYSEQHYVEQMKLARVRAIFMPTLDLMIGLSTVMVLVFGGMEVVEGSMTLGTFVAFLFLIRYLSGPMMGLGWAISLFQRGKASMLRIEELTGAPLAIVDADDAVQLEGPGAVEVRGLSFAYPVAREGEAEAGEVLREVSFRVEPGQTLGIFGPVAAGKSTIAALLTRLYDPPPGTVFVDGSDVREVTLESLRRQVVLAPQETFLFSTTVERNITLGELEGASHTAQELAELAHLHQDVMGLEHGYATMLGERGVNLSGGQRQRLAIARAVAADPVVMILDDCMSAVDSKTEGAILANLRELFAGRTGIIISHRVKAVRDCDQIIVVEEGRITERGRHEELVSGRGYYAQIAAEQVEEGGA